MVTVTLIWHVLSCNLEARDSTGLQKSFLILIYLRTSLSIITIYFVYLNLKSSSIEDTEFNQSTGLMKIYVETIIITLNSVLQTLVWFQILIVAYGWQIHRGMFRREELRKLVIIFIILYLLICFDQIIDLVLSGVKIWKVKEGML